MVSQYDNNTLLVGLKLSTEELSSVRKARKWLEDWKEYMESVDDQNGDYDIEVYEQYQHAIAMLKNIETKGEDAFSTKTRKVGEH